MKGERKMNGCGRDETKGVGGEGEESAGEGKGREEKGVSGYPYLLFIVKTYE